MAAKKPRGFGKFADALKRVVAVDKAAVDQKMAADKAKRVKARKKK